MTTHFNRLKVSLFHPVLAVVALFLILYLTGCAVTPMETHREGMESLTEKEYVIPKRPVDRHYIGCAWSKQFGPVEDPGSSDIRIKTEKSFNTMQQQFAYNVGVSLGGQSTKPARVEAGVEAGKAQRADLENVQIISPVSLADVPFELDIPYITEALRLGNFALRAEKAERAGVSVAVSSIQAGAKGASEGSAGVTGDGLVVAYKLHMIDSKTYVKLDSGSIPLELDKTIDFPNANIFVKSQLRVIEPGAGQSLPRNLLWACDRANARNKDMVAAWIIELKPKDPKRRSLSIAFPAFPKIEDCQSYSEVIYSRIDPLTDKVIRQKINVNVLEEELSDSLKPRKWDVRLSLMDESFNIKLIKQGDLESIQKGGPK